MNETIKSLLCSKERKLTEWELKFLKDIDRRLENKRLLSHKQKAVINKIFLKNNLPIEETGNKDAVIDKIFNKIGNQFPLMFVFSSDLFIQGIDFLP